jgi:oxygen-dependent protoporphyrinogen oxidase
LARAAAALDQAAPGLPFTPIAQWFDAPGFADLMAARLLAALAGLPPAAGGRAVLFTAHSLPRRVVAAGDPYPEQLAASAATIASRAGLHEPAQQEGGVSWRVAWQSAGRTPEPWLGPDVLDVLRGLPAEGVGGAVVCPVGFVADHLEVLFDLDVEARAVAEAAGLAFGRTASLNDDARFLDLLAEVVQQAAGGGPVAAGEGPATSASAAAPPAGRRRRTVAVVGGGIAGLAAAWELTGGPDGPGPGTPEVVVLEAGPHLGGKLRTEPFGGRPVDLGPDGFLGRRPEAAALCREVGLGDQLEAIGAAGAAVWAGGRRRTLPAGQLLGVPTRFGPVARSGILGLRGNLRLLLDVLAPRPDRRGPLGDRAIGPLIANKLGRRVVDRLVDPLVGGIYAGRVDEVSAAAAFPLLLSVSQGRGGLMRSLRRAQAQAETKTVGATAGSNGEEPDGSGQPDGLPPAFWALSGGLGSLVDRLAERLAGRGVTVRAGCPVDRLDRSEASGEAPWLLQTAQGTVAADAVVLAVPAGAAAGLLEPHDEDAATVLRGIEYASVALVTLDYPETTVPDDLAGTGLLVPRGSRLPPSLAGLDDPQGTLMVTACSYLSTKWPHLAQPGRFLLRASVGRFDDRRFTGLSDEELVARVQVEVGVLLGIDGPPTSSRVTRWSDGLPQYRVHHLLKVSGIEGAVRRLPGLAVAGAAYQGVGVPACVASGRTAARAVLVGSTSVP